MGNLYVYQQKLAAYKASHPELSHKAAVAKLKVEMAYQDKIMGPVGSKFVPKKSEPKKSEPEKTKPAATKNPKLELPDVFESGPISAHSKPLKLTLTDGSEVTGIFQQYTKNIDTPEFKAKAGDGFYIGPDNRMLYKEFVTAWELL